MSACMANSLSTRYLSVCTNHYRSAIPKRNHITFHFSVSDYKSGGELLSLLVKYGSLSEKIAQIYVAEVAIALGMMNRRKLCSIERYNEVDLVL